MAKRAAEKKAAMPRAWVEIEGQSVREADDTLVRAVLGAWEIKGRIEGMKEEYEAACGKIKAHLSEPATVVVEGVCRAIYARARRVTVADAEMLKSVLGARYHDLVHTEEKVSVTERLLELSLDADDPLGRAIRPALKISTGESVTLKAERPTKEEK